jgi:hypothetical protein
MLVHGDAALPAAVALGVVRVSVATAGVVRHQFGRGGRMAGVGVGGRATDHDSGGDLLAGQGGVLVVDRVSSGRRWWQVCGAEGSRDDVAQRRPQHVHWAAVALGVVRVSGATAGAVRHQFGGGGRMAGVGVGGHDSGGGLFAGQGGVVVVDRVSSGCRRWWRVCGAEGRLDDVAQRRPQHVHSAAVALGTVRVSGATAGVVRHQFGGGGRMVGVAVGGQATGSAVRGQRREHVDGPEIMAGRPARMATPLEPPGQEAVSHIRPSWTA